MRVFAIGDLHLSGHTPKPMSVFGPNWIDHERRIAENWRAAVGEEDLVLLPGDHSWALTLEEARPDLAYIGRLPGRAVMIRGNHDYWWNGIGKVRGALPNGVFAIQNDHVTVGGVTVCGTRGWRLPRRAAPAGSGRSDSGEDDDEKIYQRELTRLELSLESAARAGKPIDVAMLHYPPATDGGGETGFTRLLEAYRVKVCVYGHLHGRERWKHAVQGTHNGVEYHLASCDAIGFRPVELAGLGASTNSNSPQRLTHS